MEESAEGQQLKHRPASRWRRILVRVLLFYLVLTGMLTLLQRKLIYQPHREEQIPVSAAGPLARFVEHVQITAHDGIVLNGWRVAAQQAEPRCSIVFFPGNAGNRQWRVQPLSMLSEQGCDVWLIDYRGYGENAGSPTEEDFAKDARSVWNHLTTDQGIAPENIVVYGQSLGGGVGVRLASELCADGVSPAGLITVATFSSMVDAAKHHYPFIPINWLLVDRYQSVDRIGKVTCPLLHIHGTRDGIVPIALGRRLLEHAPEESSSGVGKQFLELPDSDHNDIFATAPDQYSHAINEFLTRAFAHTDPDAHPPR
jgi:pimeloyl-ACP methyl ester carboxylesterase